MCSPVNLKQAISARERVCVLSFRVEVSEKRA